MKYRCGCTYSIWYTACVVECSSKAYISDDVWHGVKYEVHWWSVVDVVWYCVWQCN